MLRLVLITVFSLLLTACSGLNEYEVLKQLPSETLFAQAQHAMNKGYYGKAVKNYEALDSSYPFGPHAEQAQSEIIYAYYKSSDNASAVAAADRYIHLYPRNDFVDYAYYMRGLANFHQDRGVFLNFIPSDLAERDPGSMRDAYDDFSTLIKRFPKSKYAADARQRMIYLRNMFAESEVRVAQHYLKRHAYVAAVNRANYVVQQYPQSPQTERALVVMVKANRVLGLDKPAKDAMAALKHNYPENTLV